jgi:hypothetical protein
MPELETVLEKTGLASLLWSHIFDLGLPDLFPTGKCSGYSFEVVLYAEAV